MATLDTLGLQTFPAWPASGWSLAVAGDPTAVTVSGGIEGLSIFITTGASAAVNTTSGFDANNCSLVSRFPVSEGAFTGLGCWGLVSGGPDLFGWQWDELGGVIRAVTNGSDVYEHNISTGDRYFRTDFLPGQVKWYTSPDNVNWTLRASTTMSDSWDDVTVQIADNPQNDNQTAGIVSVQGRTVQSFANEQPITLNDARDLFRQWLDTVDYTQPQSSAVLTYQQVQAQTTGYAGTYGGITVSGDTLKAFLIALFGLMANALSILGFLQGLWPTGHLPSDHDASLEAHRVATEPDGETLPAFIEGEMEIVLTAITDQTNEITQILAHGNGTEDVPTIVGESDWGNIFRFDVPADFYTVDITTTDLDATSEDVGGTQVWDHLGFCVPLTVDGLPEYGPRLAIGGQVIRTGRQMGGIILNGRRVLSGHVTAYQYQAP